MTTSTKNAIAADNALIKLSDLENDRINWETGSYKKSNDELYAILERCYHLYRDIKGMSDGKRKLIKSIDAILVTRGMTVQKNTSLVTKIVRYVFGKCGKQREHTYGRVILAAEMNMKEHQNVPAFIAAAGGIEEIRKQKEGEPSEKDKRAKLIDDAEERVATAQPLISGITLIDDLQPDNDNGVELMAVLMRKEADGTAGIMYRSNNSTIIGSLLAAYEREATAKAKETDAAAAPGKEAKSRSKTVKQAVAA